MLGIGIPINNPGTILFCLSTASLKGSVTFLKLTINPIFTLDLSSLVIATFTPERIFNISSAPMNLSDGATNISKPY